MNKHTVVLFPSWPENAYHKLLGRNLEDVGVKVIHAVGRRAFGKRFFFLRYVKWKWRADTFHIHSTFPFFNTDTSLKSSIWLLYSTVQLLILRILGVRIVWTVHDLKNHEGRLLKQDYLSSIMLSWLSHSIIVHCDTAAGAVRNRFHIRNRDKIKVLFHGNYIGEYPNEIGKTESRRRLSLRQDGIVLLFIGRIMPYKGIIEFLSAIGRHRPLNLSALIIAGKVANEDFETQIREKVKDCDWIRFEPGYVDDNDIQTYLNACDAVIVPYRHIFTSGSIFLAISFGRTCVAPKMGCIQDTLTRDIAFLYDPDREDALMEAIGSACQNREKLSRMGQQCYQLATALSWKDVARETRKIYVGRG